jgi:hypothetical protein
MTRPPFKSQISKRITSPAQFSESRYVQEKLAQLQNFDGQIPIVQACKITGYSRGGLEKKVKSGEVELTAESLTPLIVSLAPVYENWPTLTETAKRLNLPAKLLQEWAKSKSGQKQMHSVIAQKLYHISPEWVETFEKKLGNKRDKYIFSEEAAQILGCKTDEMTQFRTIKSIQPAGPKTKRLYLRSSVKAYAERTAQNKGLYTVNDMACELGVTPDYVRAHFSHERIDPVKGRLFSQRTLDEALESVASEHMRIDDVFAYCRTQFGERQIWLETKVKELLNTGTLKSFSMKTNSRRFLDEAGQKKVRNMYNNVVALSRLSPLYAESFNEEKFLGASEALLRLEWSQHNLDRLFAHTECIYLSEQFSPTVMTKLHQRDYPAYFKLMPGATRRYVRQTDLGTLAEHYNSLLD